MGNDKSQIQQLLKQYEIKSPHLMLGTCKMIMGVDKKLLKSSYQSIQKSTFETWKNAYQTQIKNLFLSSQYEQIIKNHHSHLMFIPKYYEYLETGYCSSNGIVVLVYQIIDESLINDIQIRSHTNQPYTEASIFMFVYFLTKIAGFFHEKGEILGDVRPENIFISQNQKFIKVATQFSWLGEKTSKDKYLSNQKIFITESMIKYFTENTLIPSRVIFSNDDFAIGMTLAECILLQDLSKIYETIGKKLIISRQKHEKVVEDLLRIKYYPLRLILLIIGMIQIQEQNRFTSQQVCKCLNQFKTQILTQNQVQIGKNHYRRFFGKKFDALYSILSKYKSNIHNKLFLNGQLSLSNAYTINGISTVHMVKRTQNQTFNIELLDINSNISSIQYKISQVDQNNKSWNSPEQKANQFVQKSKRSSVLDQFYQSTQKKAKSGQKYWPNLVQSSVKRISYTPQKQKKQKNNASPIPITNHNSPQLKIFQVNKGQQNFSFHSPQSRIKQDQIPVINILNKNNKVYQSNEYLDIPSEIAQSIILANHNQPHSQEYITYQYSTSNEKPNYQNNSYVGEIEQINNKNRSEVGMEMGNRSKQQRFKRKSLQIKQRKLLFKQ